MRKLIEQRKRGVFGWFFLIVFWGWNALMLFLLVSAGGGSGCEAWASEAERSGCMAGTGLAILLVLIMWATGSAILGLLAYFTRGTRVMIEVEQ